MVEKRIGNYSNGGAHGEGRTSYSSYNYETLVDWVNFEQEDINEIEHCFEYHYRFENGASEGKNVPSAKASEGIRGSAPNIQGIEHE
jgi:hypothetical protein